MTVAYDIPLNVSMDEIILNQGGDPFKKTPSDRLVELNHELLDKVLAVAQPAVIYKAFEVVKIEGKRVYLSSEDYLESKILVKFIGEDVRELMLCACTVGREVDDLIAESNRGGSSYDSFLLDGIANAVLGCVGRHAIGKATDYAGKLALEASAHVSPGQADWKLEQQSVLFKLLSPGEIGIELDEKSLMRPLKSTTMVIGIGPGVIKSEEGAPCDYCSLNAGCPQRKVRNYYAGRR